MIIFNPSGFDTLKFIVTLDVIQGYSNFSPPRRAIAQFYPACTITLSNTGHNHSTQQNQDFP